MAVLSSLKHDDIIDCLLEFIEEKNYHLDNDTGCTLAFDQKRWLSDVTNNGLDEYGDPDPNAVVDWKNANSISAAIWILAAAGQKLNAIKFMEEGIYDFIGINLPEFKSHPEYKVFPPFRSFKYKNKTYTMDPSTFSTFFTENMMETLNPQFNMPQIERPEVDPNACFNKELLQKCIDADIGIDDLISDPEYKINLVYPQPQLIWMDEIHGLEPITGHDGESRPRGFQTRADEDINHDVVDEIKCDIANKKWNPKLMQGVVFRLPKNFQGVSFSTAGVERKYGIANLTHRYHANFEDYIIAWVIDIPLDKLTKWACAIANKNQHACNPRKDTDIINSIKLDLENKNSDLSKKLEGCNQEAISKIIECEVDSYNVHHKTRNKIIRNLEQQNIVTCERKRFDSDFMKKTMKEDYSYEEIETNVYKSPNGVKALTVINQGNNHYAVAKHYCNHIVNNPNEPIQIIIANDPAKGAKIDKNNRTSKRKEVPSKVTNHIHEMYLAGKMIFEDRTAIPPQYLAVPEFNDEVKNGLINLDLCQ